MARNPTPKNQILNKLRDERDHLRIRLSLDGDRADSQNEGLAAMREQIRDIERQINQLEMSARQSCGVSGN